VPLVRTELDQDGLVVFTWGAGGEAALKEWRTVAVVNLRAYLAAEDAIHTIKRQAQRRAA
jgi:hypothetical protein